jgi:hypothetical protein
VHLEYIPKIKSKAENLIKESNILVRQEGLEIGQLFSNLKGDYNGPPSKPWG